MGLLIARPVAAVLAVLALAGAASAVRARGLISAEQALDAVFPSATPSRESVFLTEEQRALAARRAGVEIPSLLVTRYRVTRDGDTVGFAYLETHRVRTKNETLLTMLHPDGRVRRVEVLAFDEPADYLPRRPWYDQFDHRPLDDDLASGAAIRPVTGATLTARVTLEAVRRALAIHMVLASEAP